MEGSNQCPVFHTTPQEHLDWVYTLVLIFFAKNYHSFGDKLGIDPRLLHAYLDGSNEKEHACREVLRGWVYDKPGSGKKEKSWYAIWAAIHAIDRGAAHTMGDELQKVLIVLYCTLLYCIVLSPNINQLINSLYVNIV